MARTHKTSPPNPWRKEDKEARKMTRRVARQAARHLLVAGKYDSLPGTDREAGCRTSGWLSN